MDPKSRVTGIGDAFFKVRNAEAMEKWYADHLGISEEEGGGWSFRLRDLDYPDRIGMTVWSQFSADSDYFDPSESKLMINYRVADLDGVLADLTSEGVEQVGDVVEEEYGKFAWVLDPEGNKIELWQPPEEE